MKSIAYKFEKNLVVITLCLILIGGTMFSIPQIRNIGSILLFSMLIWLIPFGCIQVIHALYLRVNYNNKKDIIYHLNIYLLSVAMYFGTLGLLTLFENSHNENFTRICFALIGFTIPPCIAFYLLWICWNYQNVDIVINNKGDLIT